MTKFTKVTEVWSTFPVIRQHPSLGKVTPEAWNPMSP